MSKIPCCTCGALVEPNSRGQCVDCIRAEVDLTANIPHSVAIDRCSVCGAFHRNPQWAQMELESPQLLALCLKKTRGLTGHLHDGDDAHRLKLIDASWVWTEPHSKRLKIKVTVRAEVTGGLALQQQCVVEYVLRGGQCRECERAAAKQTWQACVQLRQKGAATPRVLHLLEQLILADGAAKGAVEIKPVKEGIDFFFDTRQHAERLVHFVGQYAMTRSKQSKQLVTHNEKAGTANVRHTWALDVAPLCKDDLVLLPRPTAASLGMPTRLCVVAKAGRTIHLVHPSTAAVALCSADQYWRHPFGAAFSRPAARAFEVLDCELEAAGRGGAARGAAEPSAARFAVGDAQVVRGSDYERVLSVLTHLGRVLGAGDTALGYDLGTSSMAEEMLAQLPAGSELPDVVLIGKVHAGRRKHRKRRGTHTRGRRRAADGDSTAGSETASVISATDSELAAELDGLMEELDKRAAEGAEVLEPGAQLARLELDDPLGAVGEGSGEDEDDEAAEPEGSARADLGAAAADDRAAAGRGREAEAAGAERRDGHGAGRTDSAPSLEADGPEGAAAGTAAGGGADEAADG